MLCSQLVSIAAKWPQKIGRFPQCAYLWFISHNGSNSESFSLSILPLQTNSPALRQVHCALSARASSSVSCLIKLSSLIQCILLSGCLSSLHLYPSTSSISSWSPTVFRSLASSLTFLSWGQACDGHPGLCWQWSTVLRGSRRWPLAWIASHQFPRWYTGSYRGGGGKQGKTHLVPLQMVQTLCQTAQFHPKTDSLHHRSAVTSPSLSPQQTSWLNASLSLSGTCTQTQRGKKTMEPNKHLSALSDSSAHCVNAADGVEWQRCLFPQQRN